MFPRVWPWMLQSRRNKIYGTLSCHLGSVINGKIGTISVCLRIIPEALYEPIKAYIAWNYFIVLHDLVLVLLQSRLNADRIPMDNFRWIGQMSLKHSCVDNGQVRIVSEQARIHHSCLSESVSIINIIGSSLPFLQWYISGCFPWELPPKIEATTRVFLSTLRKWSYRHPPRKTAASLIVKDS